MLEDPDFESAYEFISEVRTNAEEWQKEFFETVRRAGQETFRPGLEDATQLWSDCENRWGSRDVYRPFVAEQMREWFEGQVKLHRALEAKIRLAWRSEVLRPLRELCNESCYGDRGCRGVARELVAHGSGSERRPRLHPGITQEVAPNENQRDPKAKP